LIRPDDTALGDTALELVLPVAAELSDISAELLAPGNLPSLWQGEELTLQAVLDYFSGQTVVQVDKGGYPLQHRHHHAGYCARGAFSPGATGAG
jgi:hypothetical protein